ncbi:MAG: endonuclease MutS2 [Candidatus Poribacteria bacterium]|nr:MAG: endonuclease MutS2 [Candidatus Poribacteria bacterium]
MRSSDTGVLEFDKWKSLLAEYAVSLSGRARILALAPSTNRDWIRSELAVCGEMVEVQRSPQPLDLNGLRSIDPIVERLQKGAVLQPAELLEVAQHLRVVARVVRFFTPRFEEGQLPELRRRLAALVPLPEVVARIGSTIGPEGEVLDDASPELRRIRNEMRRVRERIQRALERYLNDPEYGPALQERIVTIRNDRYVLPVKREGRGIVRGLVHGQSASGATVFVEPFPIVELNNRLSELVSEESEEIARILAELSGLLREHQAVLNANVRTLAELDALRAKADYALDYRCAPPEIVEGAVLDLREARHPILEHLFRRESREHPDRPPRRVVPTTLLLGDAVQGMVITGPNTGGKTVVLKTVGLCVLIAQSGMWIPAEPGSRVGIFDAVCADIGDEQSLEQSLSTFSSHMTRIIRILEQSTDRTLVLLDELGAGTDPTEGAALAQAILNALLQRGARVLVTTHHGALKAFAHQHPRLVNASMEFDERTLSPTYRLLVGVPGSSHALRIARRLGMPLEVLKEAETLLGAEAVSMEALLGEVERLRRELEAKERMLSERLDEARRKEEEYRRRLEDLRAFRAEVRQRAEREAEALLRESRALVEHTIAEIRRAQAAPETVRTARQRLDAKRQEVAQRVAAQRAELLEQAPDVQVGDRVYVRSMKALGEVVENPDEKGNVRVRVGPMTVATSVADLELRPQEEVVRAYPKPFRALAGEKVSTIRTELDVRGLRGHEAVERVDKYLDDAALAGLETVWIIHGKGTGVLRAALHEHLQDHPLVESFRLGRPEEGGAGVTVVALKS